ncbi:MAG: NnrS family protein [Oleispira sp.]
MPQSAHNTPKDPLPIWQGAFRPFFLAASIFITLGFIVWALVLSNSLPGNLAQHHPYGGWLVWHSHEMIFGFVQAIAIGFLLTASRNWTGQIGISNSMLKIIVLCWLSARIAWFIPAIPTLLLMLLDASAPLLSAFGLAQILAMGEKHNGKGSQKHNWPFVILLTAFALIQIVFHLLLIFQAEYITLLMQVAVLIMAAMTFWVSGRVLPFFTRARLQAPARDLPKGLLEFSMTSSWLIIPFYLAAQYVDMTALSIITAMIALCAAVSQSYRLALFYRTGVTQEPMLWSLYLAFAWLIAGYTLIAIDLLMGIKDLSTGMQLPWLHAMTIGGLLSMIISMMARISLGHTGRKIRALPYMALCFTLLQIATLIRLIGPSVAPEISYMLAIFCIISALAIFLFHYGKILWLPRADG